MKFNSKCIITSANAKTGISSKTNAPYQILSIEYLACDNFVPTVSPDGKSRGVSFAKSNLPYEQLANISECPAVYDVAFDIVTNYKNEQVIAPIGVQFVSSLSEHFKAGK